MSHYAKVFNGIVQKLIIAEEGFQNFYIDDVQGRWIQTSYNTKGGIHYGPDGKPDGGVALRGNYAAVGYTYNALNDVFYPPQPFPSWTISAPTWTWQPPTPMPTDGKLYKWDEPTKTWIAIN
jgi:hypothetical protein